MVLDARPGSCSVLLIMGAALELLVIPVILVSALVVLTVVGDLSFRSVLGAGAFLGLLYFAAIKLLRMEHRVDEEDGAESHADERR